MMNFASRPFKVSSSPVEAFLHGVCKFLHSHAPARWPWCPPLHWSCGVIHNRWLTLCVSEKKKKRRTATSNGFLWIHIRLKKPAEETCISRNPVCCWWTIFIFKFSNFAGLIGFFSAGSGQSNTITWEAIPANQINERRCCETECVCWGSEAWWDLFPFWGFPLAPWS